MNAQQLKNAILQEAIEGRLVPQDPNDEPASALLARIRKEKENLVKAGKLKKKDLEVKPISEDEIPFDIPDSWEWVRVSGIFIINPKVVADDNDDAAFIPMDKIVACYGSKYSYEIRKWKNIKSSFTCFADGDVAFAKITPCFQNRKSMILENLPNGVGAGTTELKVLRQFSETIDRKYLLYFLASSYFVDEAVFKGTANQQRIIVGYLENKLFPLPPLAEQHRIVAKIEELLPKVEEYGKAQAALNKLNVELPERLKKSILQEAIEGRLVPQDPNDEPASVLLAKIRQEKEQLVKEGKLKKKDLVVTPISEDEIPFEIPESWEWCRLGNIGLFERGSGIKRDETFESGYPCVRYGEMYTKYKYAPTFEKTVSFTSKSVFEKCRKAHKGDLFMALTGENKQDISLAAQYVGDEEIAVGGDLCHFTILEAFGLYFVYLINSAYFSSKKEVLATGDIIVHISTDKLASIPIPLPPLAEQHRIVEKLEQVLGEIDKLKK